MAYKFNAGTEKEIIVSRCCEGGYLTGEYSEWYKSYNWFCEYVPKFNITPFVQAYVADNSKNNVTLLNDGTGTSASNYCGLHFEQQNDNILVYLRRWTSYTFSLLYTIPITGINTPRYLIFIWDEYHYTGNGTILYVLPESKWTSKNIENFSVGTTQGRTGLIASEGSDVDITTLPYDGRTYSGQYYVSTFATTESYYGTAPRFGYKTIINPATLTYNLHNFKSADGTSPEEVTPTPPPPPEPEDPNDEGDPSDEGGGDGDHTPDYDPIPVPDVPSDGAADAGFITLYKMTFREFDEFASKCFADNIWEAIALKFKNPTDFLVGALLLPFIPHTGLSYYPKFGLKQLDTAYARIDEQFFDLDCGSITIDKYWGSCFDYEPYTKIQIWLPYIGYKDLPVDEFMGNTVSVKYRCDCMTGDCIAFVYIGTVGGTGPQVERIIGQYYGNCGVRVPFGSASFDAAIAAGITLIGAAASSGLVAAGAAAVGAESGAGVLLASGQAAGKVVAGAAGRAASIGVVQGMKPNVQHGGAAGASGGYMGVQKPYIIRRIPRQNLPENFMNLKGYPSNIGGKLADFTGLAIVDEIQLNDIPAMEDERSEIIEWLRGGVLL